MKTLLSNLAVYPKGLWLAHLAESWRADHIHCHWAGTTATMAMVASRVSGIPWSVTTHRSDIVSNNLLPEKAASATFIRAIAEDGRSSLMERGVKPGPELLVLPMGVPVPAFTPGPNRRENVVLCAADLLPVKGHRFLIEAWKILTDRGVRARLLLAGSGPLEAPLRSQVSTLGLQKRVSFLGTLSHQKLLSLYEKGDITAVVLASIDLGGGVHEGIPVALVEAMSYGVPVIGTTTGGIPELIQPGTGLLVEPEDPAALADGLEQLLRHPARAAATGEAGRRWVAGSRDIVRVTDELEALFRGEQSSEISGVRSESAAQA